MRLWLKIMMVLGMTLAILLPLMMIRGVIQERQVWREGAVRDVAANFGGRQVFAGPVLVVPWVETVEEQVADEDGGAPRTVRRRTEGRWTFFPETLDVGGTLHPDTRRRGLHEVRVYQWDGVASASFDLRLPPAAQGVERELGRPWLSWGIADVRGLRGTPKLQLDGRAARLEQGIGHADGPGLHLRLDPPPADGRIALDTRLELQLRGTESFAMLPVARNNELRLASPWKHPRFDGVSPQHDVDGEGFRARWQVAAVASNAQRRLLQEPSVVAQASVMEAYPGGWWTPEPDAVSVSLVDPVNPYLQAERATKYGLLFVLLTFVGFFMFELIKQLRIHPIQYGLVGLALAIFFLLLVSLSEHIDFGRAYLAASAACIGLLGFYLSHVLRSRMRGTGFALMLATLYAALYGLLVSEDNALVLGAGLLFMILAAIMVVTRKVDWYQLSARVGEGRG